MKELKLLSLVLVAGTATLFTACTSESDNSPSAKVSYESVAAAQQVPVTFGTYVGEQAITRAGAAGSITSDIVLQQKNGFGVFGYYTDNTTFAAAKTAATAKPNFMYNEHVTGTLDDNTNPTLVTAWSYSPIKYWPNEFGNTAVSTGTDKLSFFAYAPYVEVANDGTLSPASTVGITSLTGNNVNGDPSVSYTFDTDPSASVDLMYGVAAAPISDGPVANTIAADAPLIDMTKQSTAGKVSFKFKHALARLGLTLQGAFDLTTGGGSPDASTVVSVESIVLTGTNFKASGVFNLNAGTWSSSTAMASPTTFTINDKLVSSIKHGDPALTGVTGTQINPVGEGNYYMFIPVSTTITNVQITYHVTTTDAKLVGGMSDITNVISKDLTTAISLTAGNAYTLNLLLGLTSVDVTASVENWDTTHNENVWLPINN